MARLRGNGRHELVVHQESTSINTQKNAKDVTLLSLELGAINLAKTAPVRVSFDNVVVRVIEGDVSTDAALD